jgi:hypothetical protein
VKIIDGMSETYYWRDEKDNNVSDNGTDYKSATAEVNLIKIVEKFINYLNTNNIIEGNAGNSDDIFVLVENLLQKLKENYPETKFKKFKMKSVHYANGFQDEKLKQTAFLLDDIEELLSYNQFINHDESVEFYNHQIQTKEITPLTLVETMIESLMYKNAARADVQSVCDKQNPTFNVDFNELFGNVILLSQQDVRKDITGRDIELTEGLEINITEENYENGQRDDLFASGQVIRNTTDYFYKNYPHVKWLCKINSNGVCYSAPADMQAVCDNGAWVKELLSPLFLDYDKEMKPASDEMLRDFEQRAKKRNVPDAVINELTAFYKITNGVPCLNGFRFHQCDDDILFEWWDNDAELWLGQCNDDVLRWTGNKFCFGNTGDDGYSYDDAFDTLAELLKFGFKEWGFDDGYGLQAGGDNGTDGSCILE